MGHTYTSLMYHCVYSTKERRRMLTPDVRSRLIPFVGGILRKRGGKLISMNGTEDHVHLLCLFDPKRSVAEYLRDIKAISSGWIHATFRSSGAFAWQEGYGAFTVSLSACPNVREYVESQEEHHKKMTFEEELIRLLDKHGVEYDPRFLLD